MKLFNFDEWVGTGDIGKKMGNHRFSDINVGRETVL